ncbi:MAG TPA: ABC transporter ATP-binding protein [Anaeromyxobacteraceae bacterium]|nr:ABC transporter ATP-binding protein [Anaeromyxobacteraceae bacterium]
MVFTVEGVGHGLGGRAVLRDLGFSVAAGERLVLLGVNGSGKTTLLKLLDGLAFPDAGRIAYQGVALTAAGLDEPAFRRRFRGEVGLLFQNVDAMLFNPTVADEIAFGPRQLGLGGVDERVERWARTFQVEPFLDRPPFELSGGEKKRVALAALLACDPKVLLLDEPTANLDPAAGARLVDFLLSRPDLTVVTSTHNLSVAEELGTRAILLAPGRPGALFDGPAAAIVKNGPLLVASGLAHLHPHRHGAGQHAHFHVHDAE